jgi:rfaE bifunctional protein kinase chain/domain
MTRDRVPVDPGRLAALVRSFTSVQVLVLADLVLDEFRYGEIARVSREAPVLILNHRSTDTVPGGGANAVNNLKALGALPVPVGRLGDDPPGDLLLKAFRQREIPTAHLWTHDGYVTPSKTRILAGSAHSVKQQVVRVDTGEPRPLTPSEEELLGTRLRRALAGCRGVLISDYGYGLLHPGNIQGILDLFRSERLPVFVDSRWQLPLFRGITAAAPNLEEAERGAGMTAEKDPRRLEAIGAKLLEATSAEAILITLGSRGMALFVPGGEPTHVPVFGSDEVADVTGAGDTVAAVFTLARIAGGSFLEAATLANLAGGLVVMKRGTATVSPQEILEAAAGLEAG